MYRSDQRWKSGQFNSEQTHFLQILHLKHSEKNITKNGHLLEVHSDGYNMDICFAQSQTQYFTMILNQANQYKLMFYSHPCGNIVISNSDNTI